MLTDNIEFSNIFYQFYKPDKILDMSPAPPKKSKFSNALEALRSETVVVADTGDVAAMEQYKPTDATTNPSLVLACLR